MKKQQFTTPYKDANTKITTIITKDATTLPIVNHTQTEWFECRWQLIICDL